MTQPAIQGPHIVDQLIAEPAATLSRWQPAHWALRHLLGPVLHYDAAAELADAVATLDGHAAMRPIRDRLALRVDARGLEHVPEGGRVLIVPTHMHFGPLPVARHSRRLGGMVG